THLGKRTCYVYGVDGKRLKKVEGLAPTQDCTALPATAATTVYFGAVEVRNWLQAGEQVLTYPHPAVKLLNGTTPAAATTLHRDGLSSVRAITNPAGAKIEAALYKPFGEQSEWVLPGNAAPETKGWIGERYDADAGLQYLNARYYDPELSLFLQPDWFEVTKAGVGTNRFSYSFNDPVNKFDPGGNYSKDPEEVDREREEEDRTKQERDEAAQQIKLAQDGPYLYEGNAVCGAIREGCSVSGSGARGGGGPVAGSGGATGVKTPKPQGPNWGRPSGKAGAEGYVPVATRDEKALLEKIFKQIGLKGNKQLTGTVSAAQADRLGRLFVGPGFRTVEQGKYLKYISADGQKIYRGPAFKQSAHPVSGEAYSRTGVQVNFETMNGSTRVSNVHLDILE
ncbi:MAG: RHS repeat-associated core domain-containing protein, partial [Tabrizicola sp.]|nr:RHS repeat-associated core domain-containing protein [Tabrizicola sp.]